MPDSQARLLARIGVASLDEALRHWLTDDDPADPGLEARGLETFAELRTLLGATQ